MENILVFFSLHRKTLNYKYVFVGHCYLHSLFMKFVNEIEYIIYNNYSTKFVNNTLFIYLLLFGFHCNYNVKKVPTRIGLKIVLSLKTYRYMIIQLNNQNLFVIVSKYVQFYFDKLHLFIIICTNGILRFLSTIS